MSDIPGNEAVLRDMLECAVGVARQLDRRGQAFGPDANISFAFDGRVYITREECGLFTIGPGDFACVDTSGRPLDNLSACTELVLHLALYRQRDGLGAAIHAHSTFATLWSCLEHPRPLDTIPARTPHLHARVGSVPIIPCPLPQDSDSPDALPLHMNGSMAYLLKNHGVIAGGRDITDAYYNLCQIEESAKLAWIMKSVTG